jgi:hypothetical protein
MQLVQIGSQSSAFLLAVLSVQILLPKIKLVGSADLLILAEL